MARGRPSKRQHIIDTAQSLFAELGYQGTSIDLVVQTAAVSKPTVYSNFPTKQVLWASVLEQVSEHSREALQEHALSGNNWLETWLALWQWWADSAERLAIYRIMLGEQHKMEDTARELFVQFEAVLQQALDNLLLQQAVTLTDTQRFVLDACSRAGVLQPALFGRTPLSVTELYQHLTSEGAAWPNLH
ncbi:TetR/AcrR family transcriptional regulator [Pokkaliibacter plantistimulans]|uniref:TetR/AcrR family transcriptional regulator n=1 Tax=Proteobacteria bacterium 228 TaxID=2083153 RepID=A0A2S5KKE1_9PROT|nr:TetR/AcrR family transcriptional regulator [Pokkaliibacter plantistimulans]PPC75192.1 TetR/AcrR family transcriptional regulator [Pokkaliibacter plantistimulans]